MHHDVHRTDLVDRSEIRDGLTTRTYVELGTVNLFLILWFWPSFIVSKFSYLCTRILLAKPNPFKSNVHNEIEQFSISESLI